MNQIFDNLATIPLEAQGGAVTIGNFDGVHRGHQAIVKRLRALADEISGPVVVFTFNPPPARLLRPHDAPESLTNIGRRAALLRKLGVDFVIVFPTTLELLQLEPEQFFDQVIVETLQAKAITEGANFRFGKKRRGDVSMLQSLCKSKNIRFELLDPELDDGAWISSTRIRALIDRGKIAEANALLVEPYRISGKVSKGAARGRTLGFPTANLEEIGVLCPPPGVYAGKIAGLSRPSFAITETDPTGLPVAINIGPNPTFGESTLNVAAHIIGYAGNIYDHELAIELLEKLRDVRKFDSKEQLLAQLAMDVNQTKEVCIRHASKRIMM